jgi:hypothetical protein
MSQQEDVLFCKIALQSGLVSQEDARRCLSYADKLEASGKPRPRIGSVFLKANLLTQPNVQRLYQAVHKRAASQSIVLREPAARAKRGARRGAKAEAAYERESEHAPRRRAMNPQIVALGIGSGVVLLVAIIVMFVMVLKSTDRGQTARGAAPDLKTNSSVSTAQDLRKSLGGGAPAAGAAAKSPSDAAANSETRRNFEAEHQNALRHARQARADGFLEPLQYLQRFKSNKAKEYGLFQDLASQLDEEIRLLDGDMVKEVDGAIQKAAEISSQGQKDDAKRMLEFIRDKVDDAQKARIDAKLREVLQ